MKYTEPIRMCDNEVHSMILQKIKKGSKVLEFGAASGRMTKLLQQDYGCTVFIVEKEQEAFASAMKYAEAGICADIEDYAWKKWNGDLFDVILFCDVLEHLNNPKQVLSETIGLLKEAGSVFLSLPNIAHNDIFVKLYERRFEYTQEGLLDDTHIRFFAENSLESFVEGTGYVITAKQYKTITTGMTEQYRADPFSCTDELRRMLRKRRNGEVYQFVLELKKETEQVSSYQKMYGHEYMPPIYGVLYFDRGNGFSQKDIKEIAGQWVQEEIYEFQETMLLDENVIRVRFDPVERQPCQVICLDCVYKDAYIQNKIVFKDQQIIMDEDPKLIWDVPKEEREWSFRLRVGIDADKIFKVLMEYSQHLGSLLRQKESKCLAKEGLLKQMGRLVMKDTVGVDIIIPIYNAYEELKKCIESIQRWTDFEHHRLVLINDCSPDERIRLYLESIRKEHCVVIHNELNYGFSANVNIGMEQSEDRDVILLNSDTVVTKNWVEKIVCCAYSDPYIATATPLSNNATLCSVPYFCKENALPKGYTVDAYAALVEKVSMKKYPKIPVSNGFCMFIKREVIRLIGGFDSETFARGYGEENDFCYRAAEAGYYHVMCDDTFILHTGTSSFESKEKRKYIEEHEKILDKRYPDLMQQVRIHCRDNPTGIVSHNIRMRTKLQNYQKRDTVMYLLQADFREDAQDHIGGTQLHVKDLTNGLRGTYNILVAARNFDYLNVTFYTPDHELFFQFYIGKKPAFEVFRSSAFAKLYGKILDAFAVGCVHIHHTSGLTLELYYEAEKRNIPIITTWHDYYSICPNVKLLDEHHRLCSDNKHNCRRCLKKQKKIAETVDYIKLWRKQQILAARMSEKIIVPSQSARQVVKTYYPQLEDLILTIEHGSDQAPVTRKRCRSSKKKHFSIAFLGAINTAKGFCKAVELIRRSDKDIDWYLFGYFEKPVPELEKRKNFHNMGPYQREKLPELMKMYGIDLICILPIWQETFCYTLSEAVLAGVPVLSTDIGAVGQRVKELDCGWTVPYQAPADEIMDRIRSVRMNVKDYQKKLWKIQKCKLKTKQEMCREYQSLYHSVFGSKGAVAYGKIDNEWLIAAHLMIGTELENCTELRNRLQSAESQLNEVYWSVSYRIALMFMKMPIPFREQLKKLLRMLVRRWRNT